MDEEFKAEFAALKTALGGLTEALSGLVTEKQAEESRKAQIEADDKAVEAKVAQVTANLDAVEAAREDLLPSQVESLRAEAKKGVDVAPLIESAKTVAKEALEAAGREVEEHQSQGRTLGVTRKVESAADLGKVFG